MRKLSVATILMGALALSACGGSKKAGVFASSGPDEMAVARRAPLVVPPDFALVPPRPGQPRAQEADSSTQALNLLYGGRARVSASEQSVINSAGGDVDAGVRSAVGDSTTKVVNKGGATRDIISAPATQGDAASVTAQ